MAEVVFFIAAFGVIAGRSDRGRCATRSTRCMALVVAPAGLAALFLLLRAEFLAARRSSSTPAR
jgi:hypothetical protein